MSIHKILMINYLVGCVWFLDTMRWVESKLIF